ncbi:MAG: GNAT family N-acetyltransferase [Alphaproteobacteria bacterium]|nr:GNAT family N-acetyltransferase [Alphaproteobacteria bacterium]
MQLKLMSTADCQAILDFETKNKTYFEQSAPPRPKAYFNHNDLHKIIQGLVKEQTAGQCLFYLAYQNNKIIARINLINIKHQSAELGYRVAKNQTGQGLATKLTANLINLAKTHNLKTLTAHTTTTNIASIRVLEKNNFKHTKTTKNATILNGQSLDFTHYTRDI